MVKYFYPRTSLQPFIESYKFLKVEDISQNYTIEDYPRTALDMVFIFDGSVNIKTKTSEKMKLSKCVFLGLIDKKYEIEISNYTTALQVRFKPNGIYPLSKIPLSEGWGNQISLDQLIGDEKENIYDQIGNEGCLTNKIDLLENYLLKKYKAANTHYKFNYCLSLIANSDSNVSVLQLASSINSNYKSLDRWFKKFVGTNPKKFLQLNRFKNILNKLEGQTQYDWMDLVADYGFHDQSHFIHQFKAIADSTPSEYLQYKASSQVA